MAKNMKGKFSSLYLMAMALAASADTSGFGELPKKGTITEEDIKKHQEAINRKLKETEDSRMKAKGLKKFWFGDTYVWALNEKTANKKYKKLNE